MINCIFTGNRSIGSFQCFHGETLVFTADYSSLRKAVYVTHLNQECGAENWAGEVSYTIEGARHSIDFSWYNNGWLTFVHKQSRRRAHYTPPFRVNNPLYEETRTISF